MNYLEFPDGSLFWQQATEVNMEFKGTKGEWGLEENSASQVNDSTCIEVRSGGGPQIAYLQSFVGWGADYERNATIANANLIAAAPDLLEALQQMVGRIEYYASLKETEQPNIEDWAYTYNSGDMDDARAAISKALGEE